AHKRSTAASPRYPFRRWPGRRLVGLPAQEGRDVEQIVLGADPRPLLGFERRQPWRGGGAGCCGGRRLRLLFRGGGGNARARDGSVFGAAAFWVSIGWV